MENKKITTIYSKETYDRLMQISENRAITLSDLIRKIIDSVLPVYERNLENEFESFGKHSLTRAERIGIFSSILSNLILRQQINVDSLAELKQLAKDIMNERWDYLDEDKK
jgi:hypothetical protein